MHLLHNKPLLLITMMKYGIRIIKRATHALVEYREGTVYTRVQCKQVNGNLHKELADYGL